MTHPPLDLFEEFFPAEDRSPTDTFVLKNEAVYLAIQTLLDDAVHGRSKTSAPPVVELVGGESQQEIVEELAAENGLSIEFGKTGLMLMAPGTELSVEIKFSMITNLTEV